MANPKIKVKRSSVEGKVPAVTQLERGELAVNSYDGKVYILRDQFSVGIATTTHTINPWNEPNGVGAGISYSGDTFTTGVTTANVLNFGDSNGSTTNIAKFGSSGDFTIQHNPSFFGGGQVFNALTSFNGNLQIENRDTSGSNRFLFLKANAVQLRSYTGNESLLIATVNQGVQLFYDNSEKFATTNTGGTLTGTLVTDGLTVGNYDFPTVAGSEGLVLKVASDGNLEFGSGASGGVVPTEKTFTASQGQTVFTDTTDLPTYIQVFVNGIKIRPTSDFSKSGASVTLVTAATAGDEIDLVRFD